MRPVRCAQHSAHPFPVRRRELPHQQRDTHAGAGAPAEADTLREQLAASEARLRARAEAAEAAAAAAAAEGERRAREAEGRLAAQADDLAELQAECRRLRGCAPCGGASPSRAPAAAAPAHCKRWQHPEPDAGQQEQLGLAATGPGDATGSVGAGHDDTAGAEAQLEALRQQSQQQAALAATLRRQLAAERRIAAESAVRTEQARADTVKGAAALQQQLDLVAAHAGARAELEDTLRRQDEELAVSGSCGRGVRESGERQVVFHTCRDGRTWRSRGSLSATQRRGCSAPVTTRTRCAPT